MSSKTCPDHHRCDNGSECVETQNEGEYGCDCSRIPDVVYAGVSCDYIATQYCNREGVISVTSFCTNNGVCNVMGESSHAHQGCDCPTGYDGDHCEYVDGQYVPGDSTGDSSYPHAAPDSTNGGLVASMIAVTVCFAVLTALLLVRRMRRKKNGVPHPAAVAKTRRADASTLQLEPNGSDSLPIRPNSMESSASSRSMFKHEDDDDYYNDVEEPAATTRDVI